MTKVVMTVGCPGSGKSTYARKLVTEEGYLYHSLDGLRAHIWGPKQRFWEGKTIGDSYANDTLMNSYWYILEAIMDSEPEALVLDNTHISESHARSVIDIMQFNYGITPELAVFMVTKDLLLQRNLSRPSDDQLKPEDIEAYNTRMMHPEAWWRDYHPKALIDNLGRAFCHD